MHGIIERGSIIVANKNLTVGLLYTALISCTYALLYQTRGSTAIYLLRY
jgi:hypothetical protein